MSSVTNQAIPSDSEESTSSNGDMLLPRLNPKDNNNALFLEGDDITWRNPFGLNLKNYGFDTAHGIPPNDLENLIDKRKLELFRIFLDDELIDLMVREANRYAEQVIIEKINDESITCNSRLNDWVETNAIEMHVFLGVLLWVGLDKKPWLSHYWSHSELYNSLVCKFMSRKRFEILLRNNADNTTCPPEDRLHKVQSLISYLVSKYQKFYISSENVCTDETMVPFRGRLKFRQYIKEKRHKSDIKIFKLCVNGAYTYNMKIYCGKESENFVVSVADKLVLGLMNNLLDSGRILFTDNWNTSVGLARKLATRGTLLVGTLRINRKCNPKNVITASLNRGQIFGIESDDGIAVLKWKNKRDVLILSTKQCIETTNIGQHQKPVSIIDYNSTKSFIDVSD
ncbi:hypothetical protein NQ314_019855 [Rhamnusium bicolor]|uniref:PiggyBac transposable element-derived protein domain-containing protein n=1 Tax=Rhamnusium bicolor TaxID=1586634 RepID=A0AAV8WM83_9CUCU|nr:hypothetical protein NQ314_019855 [Rhamnusium bicolor]